MSNILKQKLLQLMLHFSSLVLSSPIAKNASFMAFDDEQSLNINDKPPVAIANLSTAESALSVIAIECTVTSAAITYNITNIYFRYHTGCGPFCPSFSVSL